MNILPYIHNEYHYMQPLPPVRARGHSWDVYIQVPYTPLCMCHTTYKSWFTQHINAFTCFTSYLDNGDAPGE